MEVSSMFPSQHPECFSLSDESNSPPNTGRVKSPTKTPVLDDTSPDRPVIVTETGTATDAPSFTLYQVTASLCHLPSLEVS